MEDDIIKKAHGINSCQTKLGLYSFLNTITKILKKTFYKISFDISKLENINKKTKQSDNEHKLLINKEEKARSHSVIVKSNESIISDNNESLESREDDEMKYLVMTEHEVL